MPDKMFLLSCFLLMASSLCRAQTAIGPQSIVDGNSLIQFCKDLPTKSTGVEALHFGMCAGFVGGVVDAESWTQLGLKAAHQPDLRDMKFCVDSRVTNGQLVAVVLKFLNDHPEITHLSAAGLIYGALSKSFPCRT